MASSRYYVKATKGGYVVMRQYGNQRFVDSGVIRDRERAVQIANQKQRGERIHEGP